jgi:hypothetical protein
MGDLNADLKHANIQPANALLEMLALIDANKIEPLGIQR